MSPSARSRIECNVEDSESQTIEQYLKHRSFEERFFGKPANGISADDALDLLEKAKGPPILKIDRQGEPGVAQPADESELD